MVVMENLFIEVVSIVIQHPLNTLCSMVKDELQFRPLNFNQKFVNASEKILCPGNFYPASAPFIYPKSQKSEGGRSGL
jgi:hypothetical protein